MGDSFGRNGTGFGPGRLPVRRGCRRWGTEGHDGGGAGRVELPGRSRAVTAAVPAVTAAVPQAPRLAPRTKALAAAACRVRAAAAACTACRRWMARAAAPMEARDSAAAEGGTPSGAAMLRE